jgi:hypothetical protein
MTRVDTAPREKEPDTPPKEQPTAPEPAGYSPEEEEEVAKRLEDLGYI